MSDSSYNPSYETHNSPRHMPSILSSPKPPYSPTLAEISPPANAPTTLHASLISSITQHEYPPVLPTSAETILALDPTLSATICATAYGLASTIRQCTEQYSQCLTEAGLRII